jgi:hypothetical protein
MEKDPESVGGIKAKLEALTGNLKALRRQLKSEGNKVYSKQYAKKRYEADEDYRKRQNENAKARYYRLKEDKKIKEVI